MRFAIAAAAALALLWPASARAGAWTIEQGVLWGKLALLHLDSDRIFADENDERFGLMGCVTADGRPAGVEAGDRRPYDCTTGGTFIATALYLDLAVGIADGVDARLQLPYVLHTGFENESGLSGEDSGLGDLRLGAQIRLLERPVVAALQLEVKAPTGRFTTDVAVPPLGEGQWDIALRAMAGRAFGRWYAGADVGYRARFENPDTRIDVGDEVLANVEGGVRALSWLGLYTGTDLLWGFDSTEQGAPGPRPGRWVWHLRGTVAVAVHHHVNLEAAVRWPLAGEGWPADPVWSLGVTARTAPLWGGGPNGNRGTGD